MLRRSNLTALIVIGAIIVGGICYIVDEGSFFSKLALAALVAAIAFVLLRWITGWELMTTLAKVSAATTILSTLVNIVRKIVD